MKRGYVVLIIGAALLISGIIISILWTVPLTGTILSENTIVSGASIKPAGSVNAYIPVIDVSRPVSLGIHVERNNSSTGGQVPNNILRETATRAEIEGSGDNVSVSWWEKSGGKDAPVMRVSNDAGKTFGELIKLTANSTMAN